MEDNEIASLFMAQTTNVRALEQAWSHINKTINAAYSNGDVASAEIHTKLLAQIYCAFAEAVFSKLIHTPGGLTESEIAQIKSRGKSNVVSGWKKCVELSLRKVEGQSSGHVANTKKKINELIDLYIYDPSLLRNKIAHGQWKVALNKNNTRVNARLTEQLQEIDVVKLYRFKKAFQSLYRIVEDIIESPNKAHHRDYWCHIVQFEQTQTKMSNWTLERKIEGLRKKKSYFSGQ